MQDRPTPDELLAAVRALLERDVLPALTDRGLRYQALIALSALGIVEREAAGEAGRLGTELARLEHLLGLPHVPAPAEPAELRARVIAANRELCDRIRTGEADGDPWRARVLAHLREAVEDKVATSNPARLATLRRSRAEERTS